MKAAAKSLASTDLKGDAARKILKDLCKFRPYVVDCSIVDTNGIKVTVEPEAYRNLENMDRSSLPSVIQLLKDRKPVMSDVYRASEGVYAVSVGYPIVSDKGDLLGGVRMLIKHEVFLKPLVEGKPCKVWVMQRDGLIVYDYNTDEIGRNIFTDEMYRPFDDLVNFAKTVALSNNGAGSYSFYSAPEKGDKTLVEKVAAWDTAGMNGNEWRIIAMETDSVIEQSAKPSGTEKRQLINERQDIQKHQGDRRGPLGLHSGPRPHNVFSQVLKVAGRVRHQ
jgi:hypothetical protein